MAAAGTVRIEMSIRISHLLITNGECSRHPFVNRLLMVIRRCDMQNSILISDAQVRPAGISVEEGMKALKCEIRKLAKTKSETFSYLCGEAVTYGEVAMTMAGFFAFMAAAVLGGFIMGGEVM